MNETTLADRTTAFAADQAHRAMDLLQRRLAEMTAALTVDEDGSLDNTAAMLRLKRGCRR
jgi:hypothetical protein